jgi:hypothetical protein
MTTAKEGREREKTATKDDEEEEVITHYLQIIQFSCQG